MISLNVFSRARWAGAVVCAGVLLCSASAPAEPNQRWRTIADTVFLTLPQSADQPTVLVPRVLAEDNAGFLWAGGEAGLLRWDGYTFRYYSAERVPSDGLENHDIEALHRDRGGRLWVGTARGELAFYDSVQDRFVTVPLGPERAALRQISDDCSGGLWVVGADVLVHLDATGAVIARLRHEQEHAGSLPDGKFSAALCDDRGALWVGGTGGLVRAEAGQDFFKPIPIVAPPGQTIDVSSLAQDGGHRIWIGTHQNGAFLLAPDDAAARPVQSDADTDMASLQIMSVAETAPGKIWLATYGGGIVEVDAESLRTRRMRHDPLVPRSLDTDIVYALYRDRSGLVWVGTHAGLSQYRPSPGIMTAFGTPGRRGSLSAVDATALMTHSDGSLWVVSHRNGVDIIDRDGHVAANVPVDRVNAIAEQQGGAVLLGTRSGLFCVDPVTRQVTRLEVPGRPASASIYSLFVQGSHIWLGGADDGLWELGVAASGKMLVLRHADAPSLLNATIHSIGMAPDGRIAIGTSNGLNLLDATTGALEQIVHDAANPHSLGPGLATAFLTDRRGRLWVATDETGIYVLIGRDGQGHPRFRQIGLAEGLPNGSVDNLLADRNGRIWVSTDNGLAVIDPDTLAVRALRAVDGAIISDYWCNSGAVTPQGDIVFGGNGGITVVQPDQVGTWRYRPAVKATEIRVGGVTLSGLAPEQLVVVRPEANSVAVEFAALDLSAPDSNRYRYRLDGYDTDWLRSDAHHRVAAYTNLPPGDYTLRLQGSNREGVWSEPPTLLRIRVLPAWFQTLWFRLAEAGGAALLVFGLVQGRTAILHRRKHDLEQLVIERTAKLSESQRELHKIAYTDTLTGLPNRRAFNEMVQALIDGDKQAGFGLMLIDLDGFKSVNDALGHDAGDAVLVIAADRLREAVRENDYVARLGGDEFAILLIGARHRSVVDWVGQRVVASMAAVTSVGNEPVTLGASAGASLFPQDGASQEALYKHADLALYDAKRAGRGVWRLYGASVQEQA